MPQKLYRGNWIFFVLRCIMNHIKITSMKKAFLISALAVALVSCGGNSNQNQGDSQSADSTNAQNKKIYVDDDCPYFCLIENRYPDGSNAFDRIYICGGIIYKYLDNSKKELPLTSEVMHREQKSISHLLFIAKSNESKAK